MSLLEIMMKDIKDAKLSDDKNYVELVAKEEALKKEYNRARLARENYYDAI